MCRTTCSVELVRHLNKLKTIKEGKIILENLHFALSIFDFTI